MAATSKKSSKLKEPVRVRTKKLADGSESYYLDIYINGKRSYEFLKMYHLPEVNARVREQNRATREAVETIKSQRIIEITNSRAGIRNKSAWQKLTLADWLEKFYSNQERKGIKRIDKLRSIIKVINQYGKSTRMGDIDKKWALGFIDWLQHTYKGRQGKLLEQGTVVAYISQLSIALNAAVRAEWLEENPFMLLSTSERVKKPESKRQFLAIEEVKLLIATECRNMTVKQAYLTTNKILKQWVEKAGIDKKITYHTSRHTFGTMMMTVGADLYTTCKLMGHADVRTTQIYAKIVDSKKIEAVNMVDRMFEQTESDR